MEIPIIVEPTGDNGFRASSGGLWGLAIEAPTREEAVERLRELIDRRLEAGAELLSLEIPSRSYPLAPQTRRESNEQSCLEMAKLCQQSFEHRRSYEWKIAFGLWTGIGVFTYFATQHAGGISGGAFWLLGIAYVLLGLVWVLLWQPALHSAHRTDKRWKHYYMHRAENRPEGRSKPDPWRDESKIPWWQQQRERLAELRQPWPWVQGVPTLLFLVLSFLIIHGSSNEVPVPVGEDVISISGDNATKVVDKLTRDPERQ